MRKGHVCQNAYRGEGARGGCYFEITSGAKADTAHLEVGWSCVVVHQRDIPVTWLSELIAIATEHKDGIAGFLRERGHDYALTCDPAQENAA